MSLIQGYNLFGKCLIPLIAHDRNIIWNYCMRECESHLIRMDFDQIIREVCGEIPSHISNIDSESSSLGSLDTLMETT